MLHALHKTVHTEGKDWNLSAVAGKFTATVGNVSKFLSLMSNFRKSYLLTINCWEIRSLCLQSF